MKTHIIGNILKARLGYSVGCKGLNKYTKRGVDYNVTNNYKAGKFFAACNEFFFYKGNVMKIPKSTS